MNKKLNFVREAVKFLLLKYLNVFPYLFRASMFFFLLFAFKNKQMENKISTQNIELKKKKIDVYIHKYNKPHQI